MTMIKKFWTSDKLLGLFLFLFKDMVVRPFYFNK
jgi:hypothetical protein